MTVYSLNTDWVGMVKIDVGQVHTFWEDHKILQNLHVTFVLCSASQKQGGDFAKFWSLLRIFELYLDA